MYFHDRNQIVTTRSPLSRGGPRPAACAC